MNILGLLSRYFAKEEDGRARPIDPPKIEPLMPQKKFDPTGGARKGTLAAVVGVGVAIALGVFIPQEESGRRTEASVAEDGSLVVKHLSGKQYLKAYIDVVGAATICDGLTRIDGRPVRKGDYRDEEECAALLEAELVKHAVLAMRCTPGIALSYDPETERVREGPRFTAVSLAYNIGPPKYCGSSAARLWNAGRYAQGCDAATRWNRGGNRVLPGLVKRRGLEHNVCVDGLSANFRR